MMVGHCAFAVQAIPVAVHCPALGHCAAFVHGPFVTEQVPVIAGQSESFVQAVPVWILQLPTIGQVVCNVQVGHSGPEHVLQPAGLYVVVHPELL